MIVVKTQMEEMPKNCYQCPFAMLEYKKLSKGRFKTVSFGCAATDKTITSTRRNKFCPLIEMNEVKE